jgi:LuxR family transcriptional regulator
LARYRNIGPIAGGDSPNREAAGLAPLGHYVALRVGFAFPMAEYNFLPTDWIDHYTRQNYMLADPVMHWLYQNDGATRWSEIKLPDPRDVLLAAARFGLTYGVAICFCEPGQTGLRSFGNFLRGDREFNDSEIADLQDWLRVLHTSMVPPTNLTKAELEVLRMIKDGRLVKEIAGILGVSEGAIKQRLKNAKSKLQAKTGSQAVSSATGYGLI